MLQFISKRIYGYRFYTACLETRGGTSFLYTAPKSPKGDLKLVLYCINPVLRMGQ